MRLVRFLVKVGAQTTATFLVVAVVAGVVLLLVGAPGLFVVVGAIVIGGIAGALVFDHHLPEDDPVDENSAFRRLYRWSTGGPDQTT